MEDVLCASKLPNFEELNQWFSAKTCWMIECVPGLIPVDQFFELLADKKFRDMKVSKCRNPLVVQFWVEIAEKAGGEGSLKNIVPYITSKFDVFLSNDIMRPIVAQEVSSFNSSSIISNLLFM